MLATDRGQEVHVGTRARRTRRFATFAATAALLGACFVGGGAAGAEEEVDKVTVGYSAWPGWFPLAVSEEAGIFEENGLDVELRYFSDYIGSLDAMAAGKLDANTQTLNDTMAAVAAGSKQSIVVVNDNSAGNDAIICDESIASIADLKGKTVAAEQGVVDHFLLLQGLETVGLTEDDIEFRGVLTAGRRRASQPVSSTASACSRRSRSRRSSDPDRRWSSARPISRASSPITSW